MKEAEKQKLVDLLKSNPFEFKTHEELADFLFDMGLGFVSDSDVQNDLIQIELCDSPWEIAKKLIDKTYTCTPVIGSAYERQLFEKDDLLKIGKHLVNYVETERSNENEA